jgi:hypothetical protein
VLPALARLPRPIWRPDGYIGNPRRPGFTPLGMMVGFWLWVASTSFLATLGAIAVHAPAAMPIGLTAAVLTLVAAVTVVERSLQP